VQLTCIFDPARLTAPESARKLASWGSRVAGATQAVGELRTFLSTGAASRVALHNTPPPELTLEQVKRTLQEEGVSCAVSLEAEADDELVRLVRSGQAYAVLSGDSDFAVAEGCRLIPLGLLDDRALQEAGGPLDAQAAPPATIGAWIVEPERVAAAMGASSVRAMVDACLLAGQDNTLEAVTRHDAAARLGIRTAPERAAVASIAAALAERPIDLAHELPSLVGMVPADADAWRAALRSAQAFYLADGCDEPGDAWVGRLPPSCAMVAQRTRDDTLPAWALSLVAHDRVWPPGSVPYERPWGDEATGGSSQAHAPLRARLYAELQPPEKATRVVTEYGWDGRFWGSGVREAALAPPPPRLALAGEGLAAAEAAAAAAGALPGAPWARMRSLLADEEPGEAAPGVAGGTDPAMELEAWPAFAALTLRYLLSLKSGGGAAAATVRRLTAWQAEACVAAFALAMRTHADCAAGAAEPPRADFAPGPPWRALEVSSLLQSCVTHAYAAADVAGPPGVRRAAPPPAALFSGAAFRRLFLAAEAAARSRPPAAAAEGLASCVRPDGAGPAWWAAEMGPEGATAARALARAALARLPSPETLFAACEADDGELSAADELLQRWAGDLLDVSLLASEEGEAEAEAEEEEGGLLLRLALARAAPPGGGEDADVRYAQVALSGEARDGGRGSWEAERDARGAPPPGRMPVEEHLEALLALTRAHPVVCFSGETGCGKSTVIPLALLRSAEADAEAASADGAAAPPALVVVTQPRRIAAISLAQRVAGSLGESVGGTVGFAIGNDFVGSPATRLLFVTTGWLLHMAAAPATRGRAGGVLERASHLVLDEAHDRSLDADFLSLLLKRRMLAAAAVAVAGGAAPPRMPKLVVMSATLQGDLFRQYFSASAQPLLPPPPLPLAAGEYVSRARAAHAAAAAAAFAAAAASAAAAPPPPPPMHVGVRRFPVREVYLDELMQIGITRQSLLFDASSECRDIDSVLQDKSRRKPRASPRLLDVAILVAMHLSRPGSTVLIFLPGSAEIETARLALLSRSEGRAPIEAFALHSLLPAELQAEALARPPPGVARVLLATDIAESSLTLPDVSVVVDACLRRGAQWNEAKAMSSLVTSFASHASAAQRAGRTGRVQPGTVVRLLSRASFAKLAPHDEPEMLRSALDDVILRAKLVLSAEAAEQGVSGLLASALSPPKPEEVASSLARLSLLGCLPPDQGENGRLTALGAFAASLARLRVPVARALLLATALGHPCEGVLLAAALTLDAPPFRQVLSIFAKSPLALADDVAANTRFRATLDGGRASDVLAWVRLYRMWALAPRGGWAAGAAAGGPGGPPFDARAWRQLAPQLNPRAMRAFHSAVRGLGRDLPRAARAAGQPLSDEQMMQLARLCASGGPREVAEGESAAPPAPPPPAASEPLLRFLAVMAAGQNVMVAKRKRNFSVATCDSLREAKVDVAACVALIAPDSLHGPDGKHAYLRSALDRALDGGERQEGLPGWRASPLERMLMLRSVRPGATMAQPRPASEPPPAESAGRREGGAAAAQMESALFLTFRSEAAPPTTAAPLLCDDVPLAAKYLVSLGTGRAASPLPLPDGPLPSPPPPPAPAAAAAAAAAAAPLAIGLQEGVAAVTARLPFPLTWSWLYGPPRRRAPDAGEAPKPPPPAGAGGSALPRVDVAWTTCLFGVSESPASLKRAGAAHSPRRYAVAGDLLLMEDRKLLARSLTLLPTNGLAAELWLLASADASRAVEATTGALESGETVVTQLMLGAGVGAGAPMPLAPFYLTLADWEAVNELRAAMSDVVLRGGDGGALAAALARLLELGDETAARSGALDGNGAEAACFCLRTLAEPGPWPRFDLDFLQ